MSAVKTWHVDIYISERDGKTHADARLRVGSTVTLTGEGSGRLNPTDRNVPEIGDELSVARSLSDLAHRLLQAAAGDIEVITHESVELTTER